MCGYAQNTPQNHKIYDTKDGFLVEDVNTMFFDNDDWLWIAGSYADNNEFKTGNKHAIIQRYNGSSFHTIPLPELPLNAFAKECSIKKRQDGQIYIYIVTTDNISRLFLLNPKTLYTKEIQLPEHLATTTLTGFYSFPYKDDFVIFTSDNVKSYIHILNTDLSVELLQEIPQRKDLYATHFMEFEDHFIIGDDRSGVLTFDNEGNFLSILDTQELELSDELIDYKLNIGSLFKHNNTFYASFFAGKEIYYSYDPKNKKWTRVAIFQDKKNKKTKQLFSNVIHNDEQGNILSFDSYDNELGLRMTRYLNDLDKPDFNYSINFKIPPLFSSRNFEKEVFLGYDGQLHHITFESPNFSLSLNEYSIRSILPIENDNVLISTERNGWYILNTQTKKITPYKVTLNNQLYIPSENRGFLKTSTGYWSTYNKGIIHVDDISRKLKTYIHYPVATMVEDSLFIYYGTFKYKLMRFDKTREIHEVLANTDTLDIQRIVRKDNVIYGATGSGLLVYENNKASLYKVSDIIDDNFLLTIDHTDSYGILIGSRSGKLYQFQKETKSFKTIYSDELQASIATFLIDKKERIWINTFSGIVAFDPSNQLTTRYGESDGMSHYESNRYSASKTKDGYFLVGTLEGLNYFHPDSLSKNKINASLQLSSVTYFDKKTGVPKRELSPERLNTLKTITLPAEHRNLNLEFGLLGMFINETVSYRYRFNQEDWNNLERKNQLNLVSLSPGNYDLEVEALDSSQQKIGESLHVHIYAKNFIYKSFWFYMALVVLLGALGLWYILQLKKRHNLKEQFATQLINTQENERSRIAKELHDSIGQKLLLLKNTLLLKTERTAHDISLVEETIHEVREMSHNLHPFQFEQLGLTQSLRNVIDAFQKTSPIFFSADIDEIEGLIAKEKEIFIFRMLQECISNVIKHAKATACNLHVTKNEKTIQFQLKDNGEGFNPELYKNNSSSLGLRTLRERAQYIDAQLQISSASQKGTIITITVLIS